jgi:DeoR family suf operon transcriptional repressor
MPTSRQRILEYICTKEAATAPEISSALHMTASNARHHLSALRDEGVVIVIGQRPKEGRGRPVDLYRLAQPVARHNLDGLAHSLLNELLKDTPPNEKEAILEKIALHLAPETSPKTKNLTQRLSQAVQHINQLNYQARWEAHAQGPRLIFQHCPYAAILAQHPEVCTMDRYLLRILLGLPVQQVSKLEGTLTGIPQCVFRIG